MKKICFVALFIASLINIKSYAIEFTDIENHWAKNEIIESTENLIVNGYLDNTFRPNSTVTLAEYLKVIIESGKFDLIRKGNNYFPDYFINTAIEKGLILQNEFSDYNKKLTRNDVARITARYINFVGVAHHDDPQKTSLIDLDENYKSEIKSLINLKVIKGYEDNTFRGEKEVTRAESVVIAKRATNVRRKIISSKNYKDEEKLKYSNIKKEDSNELCYETRNEKIYIYDYGRYSSLQGYEVSGKNINIKKIVKIINTLIDEDSYTEVLYVPDKNIFNQLIIRRGENKNNTEIGGCDFSLTYYEDKPYELKRISKKDIFSEECYMKISLIKMWRDGSKLNRNEYIDEYKKEKLRKVLEIEFGGNNANKMLDYMIEKYEEKLSKETAGKMITEQKTFGKYIVNYYKYSDGSPNFYISKK